MYHHQLNRPFYGVIKSNVMIENIFKQTKYANRIIYIEDIIDIVSKNPYKLTSGIENRKIKQLTEKLLENTIFENNNKNKNKNKKKNINENENENCNTLKSIIANNFADEENEVRRECYNIRNYQMQLQSIKTELNIKIIYCTINYKNKLRIAACGLMHRMFVLLLLNML